MGEREKQKEREVGGGAVQHVWVNTKKPVLADITGTLHIKSGGIPVTMPNDGGTQVKNHERLTKKVCDATKRRCSALHSRPYQARHLTSAQT